MDKWNLIVDVPRCENCNNCVLASKDELVGNDFPGYSAPHPAQGPGVIRIRRGIRGQAPLVDVSYLPTMCNHCDNAPCVAAGDDAIKKRTDGIVIIDPVKAKGRRDLVDACPYGAIVWNEAEQLPQNWFFDAHLLDQGWPAPRCVNVCPTNVFEAVKVTDEAMAKRAKDENLRPLRPELGTKPRVYYRHLDRFDHCFIAGSVTAEINGTIECVEGAVVEIARNGQSIGTAKTNEFGDFKLDGLPVNSGTYEVVAHHNGHGRVIATASLGESVNLGEMRLRA